MADQKTPAGEPTGSKSPANKGEPKLDPKRRDRFVSDGSEFVVVAEPPKKKKS